MAHSIYTPELGEKICDRVAAGDTITKVCKDPTMPSRDTVWKWRKKHKEFADLYALAQMQQVEYYMSEIIDLADDDSKDFYLGEKGNSLPNGVHINRVRMQVDVRKFALAKVLPKKLRLQGKLSEQALRVLEAMGEGNIQLENGNEMLKGIATAASVKKVDELEPLLLETAKTARELKKNSKDDKQHI